MRWKLLQTSGVDAKDDTREAKINLTLQPFTSEKIAFVREKADRRRFISHANNVQMHLNVRGRWISEIWLVEVSPLIS